MQIQLIYIALQAEFVEQIDIAVGSTVHDALNQSGLLEKHKEISLDINKVGIYGEVVSLETILNENDRVEVYRSLKMPPMDSRRLRQLHQ